MKRGKQKREDLQAHPTPWRAHLYEVIFEAETPSGKTFDIVLLWAIFISVFVVVLESVRPLRIDFGPVFRSLEWFFTVLFTIEYIIRIICVKRKSRYIFSFFGIVDLLAVIPTYVALFLSGAQSLMVIRALRLLRVFRVLKLGRYLEEMQVLAKAVRASRDKIMVFLMVVLTLTVIMGTVMYLVEGAAHGFTSIPRSIYWAIVTMTTVGYGDISPQTPLGQILAAMVMIMGYAIIVVPTGIFSVELSQAAKTAKGVTVCPQCKAGGHEDDAIFCRYCGTKLSS